MAIYKFYGFLNLLKTVSFESEGRWFVLVIIVSGKMYRLQEFIRYVIQVNRAIGKIRGYFIIMSKNMSLCNLKNL